jgi:hypothetical protein
MHNTVTTLPAQITAGDTLTFTQTLADYPANNGWVLHYRLINALGKFDITSSASGSDHLISVLAATTAGYTAGTYDWQAYVDGVSSQRFTIGTGRVVIMPNLAGQSAGFDNRSTARKALDSINAWLANRDLAVAEYQIAGRSMKYIPITELLSLRSKLQFEVKGEDKAAAMMRGESISNKLLVRF